MANLVTVNQKILADWRCDLHSSKLNEISGYRLLISVSITSANGQSLFKTCKLTFIDLISRFLDFQKNVDHFQAFLLLRASLLLLVSLLLEGVIPVAKFIVHES
jgi:hypothetical protein